MNKPLKDWTLGEVREHCRKSKCDGCCLKDALKGLCKIDVLSPCDWHLNDTPHWTAEEAVKRVYPQTEEVGRSERGGAIYLKAAWGAAKSVYGNLFPSLKAGETVMLNEILGTEGK